jgi:hypothetical protein
MYEMFINFYIEAFSADYNLPEHPGPECPTSNQNTKVVNSQVQKLRNGTGETTVNNHTQGCMAMAILM